VKTYFPALTGIRAIAAYMVFIYHYFPFNYSNLKGTFLADFFNEFHTGVTVFFVLSGFLITHQYYNRSDFNFLSYLKKRFFRIFPLYFILTTITFVYIAFYKTHAILVFLKMYLLNITLLRGFFENYYLSGIAQGWSLTVEEQFYLIAPLLFVLIKKNKNNILFFSVVFVVAGFLLVYLCKDLNWYGFMNHYFFMMNFTFFGRVFEFSAGIALALLVKNNNDNFQTKYATLFGAFFSLVCIFALPFFKSETGNGKSHYAGVIINNLVLPIFGIAPLLWGLIYEKTFFSSILSGKIFSLLGKSSYAFYLIHLGVFVTFFNFFYSNYILLFVFLNLIAIMLYLKVEKPLHTFFSQIKHR